VLGSTPFLGLYPAPPCTRALGAQRVTVQVTLDGDSDTAQIVKRRTAPGTTP
jgi:hypothetical protein